MGAGEDEDGYFGYILSLHHPGLVVRVGPTRIFVEVAFEATGEELDDFYLGISERFT